MSLTTTLRPLSLFFILLSTFVSLITAQTVLDSSKLPSCYTKCTPLEQANSACVPPAAPATNQGTYQGCFCASQFLVTLYSTPNGLCDTACSGSDLAQIQAWYLGLCHGGVVVTPAGGAQVTQPAATAKTAATTDTSVTLNSPPTSTASTVVAAAGSSGPPKSWVDTHWQWILLLVILFVAFVFFLVLGFWLKRRHRRRRDAKNFSGTGQLRNANSPSPFASGILAPSDGAYIGSQRNHRPMSVVPDTRSVVTMERFGSPRESMLAMSVYSRDFHDVPSPPPLGAGTRSMPWLGERQDSGETGGSVRSKLGGTVLREEPVSAEEEPDVSPIEDEMPPPAEARTGRRSGESKRSSRRSSRDGVRRKLSKKSKTGSIREMNSET